MRPFRDRFEAGRILGALLEGYAPVRPVVLALPRGGVAVGYEVARALDCPLDVFVVRKLGAPGSREVAMGAIASGGTLILNEDVLEQLDVLPSELADTMSDERHELARREALYRRGRPRVDVRGRTVILVDDGMATGASMRVAIRALRDLGPAAIAVAVPVASREAVRSIRDVCDDWACVIMPEPFSSVGAWYDDFSQTTDAEVQELLARPSLRRSVVA